MDPRLLDAYLRELQFMRAMSGEFAGQHPKIAKRLGLLGVETSDKYVDRLIQTSAFVNAQAQLRFDDEFSQLTQPLLASCYPNYLSPSPAIAIARFYPGGKAQGFLSGDTIERGTELWTALPNGEKAICTFRTTQNLSLFPFVLVDGRLTDPPPDVQGLERCVPPHRRVRGALRLRFRTLDDAPFSSLQGLDSLPVYLACDEVTASHVHELIRTGAVASIIGEPGRFSEAGYAPHVVKFDAVVQDGLGPDEAVLPLTDAKFLGHNLVHEYACNPSRFYFFTLTGLKAGLGRIKGCEAEIIVLLDRSTSGLAEKVDASTFALYCVPIVNLFKARAPAKPIAEVGKSMRLVPFVDKPFDYEVYSVQEAIGQASDKEGAEEFPFHSLHTPLLYDEDGHDRYFTVYREQRLSNSKGRSYGTRVPYVGTESYLSLVRRDGRPFDDAHLPEEAQIKYLSVDVWLTNRDLPGLMQCNGVSDLNMRGSASFSSIGLVRPPSRSRAPLGLGIKAWQLFSQLNIEHADFDDRYDEPNPGEGLRRLLRLYLSSDMPVRQVESLMAATLAPVNCIVPEATPPMVRALECTVTFDEEGFDGVSPYAFGVVLERYPRTVRQVWVNVFGFSRGAAAARAFVHKLIKEWAPDGKLGPGEGKYALPYTVNFLGLFDTVAAVGMPDATRSLLNFSFAGHSSLAWAFKHGGMAFAANGGMNVPEEVRFCHHAFAVHEQRMAFALDSIRWGGSYKDDSWTEVAYPGMHSDVGGGYAPGDQGKDCGSDGKVKDSCKLSQIPLHDMYVAALKSGVPLYVKDDMPALAANDFEIDSTTIEKYNAWRGSVPEIKSLEDAMRFGMSQMLAWRTLRAQVGTGYYVTERPFYQRAKEDSMSPLQAQKAVERAYETDTQYQDLSLKLKEARTRSFGNSNGSYSMDDARAATQEIRRLEEKQKRRSEEIAGEIAHPNASTEVHPNTSRPGEEPSDIVTNDKRDLRFSSEEMRLLLGYLRPEERSRLEIDQSLPVDRPRVKHAMPSDSPEVQIISRGGLSRLNSTDTLVKFNPNDDFVLTPVQDALPFLRESTSKEAVDKLLPQHDVIALYDDFIHDSRCGFKVPWFREYAPGGYFWPRTVFVGYDDRTPWLGIDPLKVALELRQDHGVDFSTDINRLEVA